MRKIVMLLAAAVVMFACDKDEFTPTIYTKTASFESVPLNQSGIYKGATPTGELWTWGAPKYVFQFEGVYSLTAEDQYSWAGALISKNAATSETVSGYQNDTYVYGTGGANGTNNFMVIYDNTFGAGPGLESFAPYISFGPGFETTVKSIYITNSSYFYWYAKTGAGDFAGGTGFGAGDYFGVIITGYNSAGAKTSHIDFNLADYRNGKQDIATEWKKLDLSPLGNVNKITFSVYGSSDFIPSYFCLDEIAYQVDPLNIGCAN